MIDTYKIELKYHEQPHELIQIQTERNQIL